MKTFVPHFILALFCLAQPQSLTGQFNVQVGYGYGFLKPEAINEVINRHYLENDWLGNDPAKVNGFHGLYLGVKQSWTGLTLGLSWKNQMNRINMEGTSPFTQANYKRDLFYSLNTYSFFIETGGRFIGIGTSLDYSIFGIKQKTTGQDSKTSLSSESQYGNQFYVNIGFPPGNSCQFMIRLSYYLPWQKYDVKPLINNLLTSNIGLNDKADLRHFGLSLILNNGPHN